MRFHVLSTMNKAGWEETGRRMVQSFLDKWPEEAKPITIYAEDFEPDLSCEVRHLPLWMSQFKGQYGQSPIGNGNRNGAYNYVYDAVKFAHKVAAITDFGQHHSDGVMIWIDADTFTHAPVTSEWLESLFPEPAYLAWLDRKNAHPETGFVMFRCGDPWHWKFMVAFKEVYTSGDIFKLPGSTDCHALQHLVQKMLWNGHIRPPVSLSGQAVRLSHPAANGPLSACLDHMKGARKQQGRTPKSERFAIKDGNPYWT